MTEKKFSRYDLFVVAILAILQFTIVLDFVVLSPLGALLIPTLKISTQQFSWVVSAYAFSAGISGFIAAGFADRYDRKRLLLFFYAGFILGTLLCGLAPTYFMLLLARIVTGLFGGVMSAITFAIITDLFSLNVRGRVMGFVQMAFSGSQILGIPISLMVAEKFNWHYVFIMIVVLSMVVWTVIAFYLKPINAHLVFANNRNVIQQLKNTFSQSPYRKAFLATTLLATGGFMMVPFASTFSVNNLGIDADALDSLYFVVGVSTMIISPIVGRLADRVGKYTIFWMGSVWCIAVVIPYCHLGITPFWLVAVINILMFMGISSRMIASSALMTAVPEPADRGSFMSVNSSIQQISGGIATLIAGLIVSQRTDGQMENYDLLGYIVSFTMIITIVLMYGVQKYVKQKQENQSGYD
jgi:predicted MFS family arabinose efflux permease